MSDHFAMSDHVVASATKRLSLRPGAVIKFDTMRDTYVLLVPEKVVVLNETAAAVLSRLDGIRSLGEIITALGDEFEMNSDNSIEGEHRHNVLDECNDFLSELIKLKLVKVVHD